MSDAVAGIPFRPSIFNPETGELLAAGTISWFGEDKETPKNVYTDPTKQTPFANPYTLDLIGSQPIFYYDVDNGRYWVEIRPPVDLGCTCADVDPIYSFWYYPEKGGGGSTDGEVTNYITDGGFRYILNFNKSSETTGTITKPITQIADAWDFEVDNVSSLDDVENNKVDVTFDPLFESGLPGNPTNAVHVTVKEIGTSGMTKLDTVQVVGEVNWRAGKTSTQMLMGKGIVGANLNISVFLERKYNSTAPVEIISLGSIPLTENYSVGSLGFTLPALKSLAVDPDTNYCKIIYRGPTNVICEYTHTCFQIEEGTQSTPVYVEQPADEDKSRAFANNLIQPQKSSDEVDLSNYERLLVKDSRYAFMGYAGKVFDFVLADACPPDRETCDGQSRKATDYSPNNVPYKKVYDVWGTRFGGGDGIIATAAGAVITATSGKPGKPNTDWVADATAHITVAQTLKGYDYGVTVTPVEDDPLSIYLTWNDKFIAATTPYINTNIVADGADAASPELTASFLFPNTNNANIGNWYTAHLSITPSSSKIGPQAPNLFTVTDIAVGSPTVFAQSKLTFTQGAQLNYKGAQLSFAGGNLSVNADVGFLEWATLDLNQRARPVDGPSGGGNHWNQPPQTPGVSLTFSLNGNKGVQFPGNKTVTVPLVQSDGVLEIINKVKKALNNGFQYTLTFTALPAASSKVQESNVTAPFYIWFTIDGAGTDPTGSGTGRVVALLSTDTLPEAATKTAAVMDDQTFNFPEQTMFPSGLDPNFKYAAFIA